MKKSSSEKTCAGTFRGAFTLVEILVVISIIALLAAMTFALSGPVKNKIASTKAKSQLERIAIGLNEFKTTYGEFPMVSGGNNEEIWAELLIDALRGEKILRRKNSAIAMVNYNDGRANAEPRPFITLSDFELDETDEDSAKKILDPWGNPFQYRYNKISGGKLGDAWNSHTFLLISAGADFNDPATTEDYFSGNMETTGLPDLDADSAGYYFEDVRADNITNF